MNDSTSLPVSPRPLTPVEPEVYYTPECKAFSDGKTFVLVDSVTGKRVVIDRPSEAQLSGLILAFRQGCFCGETGEMLAHLINTYGNLAGDILPDLF